MSREKQIWMPFVNGTEETLPPMACVRITGKEASSGKRTVPKVELTRTTYGFGAQFLHRITWAQEVKPGKTGMMCFPLFAPIMAAFEAETTLPAVGELWGPGPAKAKLSQYVGGYRVLGKPRRGSRNSYAVLVQAEPCLSITGTLQEDLANLAEADCLADSASASLGFKVIDTMGLTEPLLTRTRVRLNWDSALNRWAVIAAACSPSVVE